MFGYVREYPPELKLKHHVLYRAVYCGLCKSMGRCTGFCSRVTLSYDGVFLALVRMALEKTKPEIQPERCFLHPFKKHPMLRQNAALAYSARVSALLVYGKVADDVADTRGAKRMLYRMAQPFAAHFRKKAGLEELRALVQQQLTQLSAYEAEPGDSFDKPADLFGAVCAECFSFGLEGEQKLLSRTVGSHVGRWIYAADALDDFEKDQKNGTYNPFARLYGAELSENDRKAIADTMKNELVSIGNAFDLMDFEDTDIRTLLYHIVFEGMHKTTEDLANRKKKGETH